MDFLSKVPVCNWHIIRWGENQIIFMKNIQIAFLTNMPFKIIFDRILIDVSNILFTKIYYILLYKGPINFFDLS